MPFYNFKLDYRESVQSHAANQLGSTKHMTCACLDWVFFWRVFFYYIVKHFVFGKC